MKVTKSYLKEIVKECLLEILQDGLGETQRIQEARGRQTQRGEPRSYPAQPKVQPQRPPAFTGPMAEIFEDTARTTLVEQMNAGDPMNHRPTLSNQALPQVEQIRGTPSQVFGDDTVARWANLAFMPPGQSLA